VDELLIHIPVVVLGAVLSKMLCQLLLLSLLLLSLLLESKSLILLLLTEFGLLSGLLKIVMDILIGLLSHDFLKAWVLSRLLIIREGPSCFGGVGVDWFWCQMLLVVVLINWHSWSSWWVLGWGWGWGWASHWNL
jgi:hypothetical protein